MTVFVKGHAANPSGWNGRTKRDPLSLQELILHENDLESTVKQPSLEITCNQYSPSNPVALVAGNINYCNEPDKTDDEVPVP